MIDLREAIDYAISQTKACGYPVVSVEETFGPCQDDAGPVVYVSVKAGDGAMSCRGTWTIWRETDGALYGEW